MSDLIPAISLTEFRKFIKESKAEEIKRLKSCEVVGDGEYLFTVIFQPTPNDISINDNIRTQAEYLAVRANTVGGLTLDEIKAGTYATV